VILLAIQLAHGRDRDGRYAGGRPMPDSTAPVLPMGRHIRARLVEMDVLIDVIDPVHRNEVMVLAVGRTLLGQLDLVGAIEMIDFPDGLSVGRNDVHVFPDLRNVRHSGLLENDPDRKRRAGEKVARVKPAKACSSDAAAPASVFAGHLPGKQLKTSGLPGSLQAGTDAIVDRYIRHLASPVLPVLFR
jgi:hypothetical protein